MDNACLKFELMGCEEPAVEPLLGYDYGYSPCVGKCVFCKLDVHGSMHHDMITKITNKMQLYR